MKRTITGFYRDEHADWVARLDCGHEQHVRHRPPFQNRPWVVEEAGRTRMLGAELDCVRCDRMEPPVDAVPYRRTPEFDANNVPPGLRSDHSTGQGIWGRILVLEGRLEYHVGAPVNTSFVVEGGSSAVVVPGVRHRVEPMESVRFLVEFSRVTDSTGD